MVGRGTPSLSSGPRFSAKMPPPPGNAGLISSPGACGISIKTPGCRIPTEARRILGGGTRCSRPGDRRYPRFAWRYRDKRLRELLILLNYFLPNTVPFLNNGLEMAEIQPMNLGLDNTEEGRFVLEATDPLYGKLAFSTGTACMVEPGPRLDGGTPGQSRAPAQPVHRNPGGKEFLARDKLRGSRARGEKAPLPLLPPPVAGATAGGGRKRERKEEGRLFFLANKNLQEPVRINLGELLAGGVKPIQVRPEWSMPAGKNG